MPMIITKSVLPASSNALDMSFLKTKTRIMKENEVNNNEINEVENTLPESFSFEAKRKKPVSNPKVRMTIKNAT